MSRNRFYGNNRLIDEMKLILRDKTPSLTVESLVFDEDNDPMSDIDRIPSHSDMRRQRQQVETIPFKSSDDEKMAHNLSEVDAEIKPIIDNIRVLALQGISKLANNPTSESYKLLKDLWMKIDKAAESSNKVEKDYSRQA